MNRQLIVAAGVAILFVAIAAYLLIGPRPLTDDERKQQIARLDAEFHAIEAEYRGASVDDRKKIERRVDAKIEEWVTAKRLLIYQEGLDSIGYISDPSPEEEAFLIAHKRELRNLVIKKKQPSDSDPVVPTVNLIGYPLEEYMTVESCELHGLLLRCLAKVKSGYPLEGWRMAAKASQWNGSEFIDLAGTSVIAPDSMGGRTSELKIMLPDRADMVFLSYR